MAARQRASSIDRALASIRRGARIGGTTLSTDTVPRLDREALAASNERSDEPVLCALRSQAYLDGYSGQECDPVEMGCSIRRLFYGLRLDFVSDRLSLR